jgi:AsmA protein
MRWIVRVGVVLAVLVVLGVGLMAMVPTERVAQVVSAQFEAMTGRKMALLGAVKPRLWPSFGVTTGPVSIANADWAESDQPLFRAESLSIDVNLGALLGGEVKILGLSADQPELNLERDKDGQANWVFAASAAGVDGAVPAPATGFTLDQGAITGGSLRFNDRQSGRVIALDDVDASLSIPDFSGPFTLSATGLSGGQPLVLDLTGGVFSAFAMGRVVPLNLALQTGGSTLAFDGRGGYAPVAAEGVLIFRTCPRLVRLWAWISPARIPALGKRSCNSPAR